MHGVQPPTLDATDHGRYNGRMGMIERQGTRLGYLPPLLALAAIAAAAAWLLHDRVGVAPPVEPPTENTVKQREENSSGAGKPPLAETNRTEPPPRSPQQRFIDRLGAAAIERTRHTKVYDPSYVGIDYPGGDVPDDRGVCADVIVRAYRGAGIDLQQRVHEDMAAHFREYPQFWGLSRPDTNIDHRRVPNLRTFFRRHGRTLPASSDPADYAPGDVVVWQFTRGRLHTGLVTDRRSADGKRPLVVHNVGAGTRVEDALLSWPICDHFRYTGNL